MTSVLFIEGAPAPYRVDFWNEFGRLVDLTVWFQAGREMGRLWDIEGLGANFRYQILPGMRLGEDKYLNPGIGRTLSAQPFDAYIMSLNCSPTEILAARWLRRRHIPFIFKSDGGFPMRGLECYTAKRGNPLKELTKRKVFPLASLWMSSGSNCTRYLRYYGADPSGIVEYPFSVRSPDASPLEPEERDARKVTEGLNGIVVIYPTRLIPGKGVDTALEAFRSLQSEPLVLLLIGSGPLGEFCREFILKHGLTNVVMKPWLQRTELSKYYQLSDILIFPTLMDTWGLTINEAMAYGLPVVTTPMAGAAHDLVHDGENGFTVRPNEPGALAERLRLLAQDSALRTRLGLRSRDLIVSYTIPRMAEKFVEAVEKLAGMKAVT